MLVKILLEAAYENIVGLPAPRCIGELYDLAMTTNLFAKVKLA